MTDSTLYHRLFDLGLEPALVVDPLSDRIVAVNAECCRFLKQSRAWLLQGRLTTLFPDQVPALVVFTESVLAKGRDRTRTLRIDNTDTGPGRLEIGGVRMDRDDRQFLVLTLYDLDERDRRDMDAQAETYLRGGIDAWNRTQALFREIEQENHLILHAAGEGIYGVDAEGVTTFVNPAAEQILGWNAADLVGHRMHGLVHHSHADGSHYPDSDCPIYDAFRNGAIRKVDNEVFWHKDGSSIWVEYTSTPILDRPIGDKGVPVGAVIVFRDVTRRREAEERLHLALQEVSQLRERLELENAYLREEIRGDLQHDLIGRSAATQAVIHQVRLVGPTDAPVLITGESGTGKELVARAIHQASQRADRPLIRVNCAAIPRDLFESEFFGHVRGAFTGALRDRVGRFELAHGGTLFLDEVGEIPLELQGKLLRVLQEGQFERVGDERTREADVRVIAATNRDLKAEMQKRSFREDLYFRLAVFPIECAPLRIRTDDIPALAAHFLAAACRKLGQPNLGLTPEDMDRLRRYVWPGNVRELQNVIERSAILAGGGRPRLDLPDYTMPIGPEPPRPAIAPAESVLTEAQRRDRDRSNILAALAASANRVSGPSGAAALLGMKPTTLASRIKALGIVPRR